MLYVCFTNSSEPNMSLAATAFAGVCESKERVPQYYMEFTSVNGVKSMGAAWVGKRNDVRGSYEQMALQWLLMVHTIPWTVSARLRTCTADVLPAYFRRCSARFLSFLFASLFSGIKSSPSKHYLGSQLVEATDRDRVLIEIPFGDRERCARTSMADPAQQIRELQQQFAALEARLGPPPAPVDRGGQTFPKSTEIRNSVAFRAFFSVFFRPCFFVVAESVSEQLLPRTGGLGGQFWLSKESVSTSATDCRIPAPICTKYGLQKSVHARIDGLYLICQISCK